MLSGPGVDQIPRQPPTQLSIGRGWQNLTNQAALILCAVDRKNASTVRTPSAQHEGELRSVGRPHRGCGRSGTATRARCALRSESSKHHPRPMRTLIGMIRHLAIQQRLPTSQQHQLPEQILHLRPPCFMHRFTVPIKTYALRSRVNNLEHWSAFLQFRVY
jgi:hypothetical protein